MLLAILFSKFLFATDRAKCIELTNRYHYKRPSVQLSDDLSMVGATGPESFNTSKYLQINRPRAGHNAHKLAHCWNQSIHRLPDKSFVVSVVWTGHKFWTVTYGVFHKPRCQGIPAQLNLRTNSATMTNITIKRHLWPSSCQLSSYFFGSSEYFK